MYRTLLALVLLPLAACDTAPVAADEDVYPSPPTPNGVLTGLLNGAPYEAPAVYRQSRNGFFVGLNADAVGPAPSYRSVEFNFSYRRGPFETGEVLPLTGPRDRQGYRDGLFASEVLGGDAVVNTWHPVDGAAGALRIVEADSVSGRFRATFEAVLVADEPENEPYQSLPDTLRFTEGEFVVDLHASTE